MFSLLLYIGVLIALGLGFSALDTSNASIDITYGHYQLHMSTVIGLLFLCIALSIVYSCYALLKKIYFLPRSIKNYWHRYRAIHEQDYIQNALFAILSGDSVNAHYFYNKLAHHRTQDNHDVIKILKAQTQLLDKNYSGAIKTYEEMCQNKKTRLLGLYGLFQQAIKSSEFEVAYQYAEKALSLSPSLAWANQALFEQAVIEKNWNRANEIFEKAKKGLSYNERFSNYERHKQAVLYTAQADDLYSKNIKEARKKIREAYHLDPNFIPTILIGAKIFFKLQEARKAEKWIEQLWQKAPHREAGRLYLFADGCINAHERLKRAERLASFNNEHFESYMAIAYAAHDASEWCIAERYVKKALEKEKRQSCYLLLADIEQARRADKVMVQHWLEKASTAPLDPCWMADGVCLRKWQAVSPICKIFDSVVFSQPVKLWKNKVEQLEDTLLEAISEQENEDRQRRLSTDPEHILEGEELLLDKATQHRDLMVLAEFPEGINEDQNVENLRPPYFSDAVWANEENIMADTLPKLSEREHHNVDDPGVVPKKPI